jgi:hypothetical protein
MERELSIRCRKNRVLYIEKSDNESVKLFFHRRAKAKPFILSF